MGGGAGRRPPAPAPRLIAAGATALETCAAEAEAQGGAWLRLLSKRVRRRLRRAGAHSTRASTRTALRRLTRFAAQKARGRTLFVAPRWRGDLEASCHNEWSLLLWAEEMATTPSRHTGRVLRADTIASYVSLIKTELSTEYGFELTSDARRLTRVMKDLRRWEPEATRRRAGTPRRRAASHRAGWANGGPCTAAQEAARAAPPPPAPRLHVAGL